MCLVSIFVLNQKPYTYKKVFEGTAPSMQQARKEIIDLAHY